MTQPRVYLAGPIAGLSYDGATEWREEATWRLKDHGIIAVSPMRAKNYLAAHGGATLAKGTSDEYRKFPLSTNKGIVTRDRFDTHTVDACIMYLLSAERVSIGTMIEVGWLDSNRVPIVLVMEPDGNIHDHGMLREIANFRVGDLEQAIDVVSGLLNY